MVKSGLGSRHPVGSEMNNGPCRPDGGNIEARLFAERVEVVVLLAGHLAVAEGDDPR